MKANPADSRAPYYLGNLFYDRRRHVEAIELWERSAKLNGQFAIVWRNLGIGYFNILKQPAWARRAYDRAFKANPGDARLLYERDQSRKRLGDKPEKRLRELKKHPGLVQQRDDLSVELCALLQPDRPARPGPAIDRRPPVSTVGGRRGRPDRAARPRATCVGTHCAGKAGILRAPGSVFERALTSPVNLNEAKHLLANQSDVHYRLGCAHAGLGDAESARHHWQKAAGFKGDFQEMKVRAFSEMTYYSARAWEKLGTEGRRPENFCAIQSWFTRKNSRRRRPGSTTLPRHCRRCCSLTMTCNSGRRRRRCF